MFLASSAKPIDDNLKNFVDEIEAQSPSLSVLAARQFRYSLRQTPVEINIKEPRQFNVLEEFIIRAAIEFQPPPTEDELASVLGLDSVFIKTTTATLRSLQTLSATSPITVTSEGRSFYEKGSVPQPPYAVQINAITDPLSDKITFQSESLNETVINLPDLADFITIDNTIADIASLPLEEIQKSIQTSGLALHIPEEGKIVTSCKVLASTQKIWRKISLFIIFDSLEDKLSIQIKNGKQILEPASNCLELLHAEGKISLQTLCKLSIETINFQCEAILKQKNTEIEARLEKIRQKALESATKAGEKVDNYKALGEAVQLRDGQISLVFSEVLNSAKSQILIYSPLVNQAVVNEKFLNLLQKLANRGVRILIGYGIARLQEDEDKPIPPEVGKKLRAIKTPHGLPSAQVFWLGDSHVKEVIVDKEIYLCGSHNWLSYRGDYLPQGESVYKVTIPHQVQEAYEFLANRFQNHAQKLWKNALENRDSKLAIESLCVWGVLGMEDIALKEIQKNKWFELLPVWLNVALQGLKSKNLSCDSASFKSALSLLSQVSTEEEFIELLQQGWCKVIGAIAINNPKTALHLLSDEVWAQFLRLNIAQKSDSPENFISQYT
ncbi:phospholipase D-like domain-containing protein [Nostoc sp. UIC 10607]|uniref:phospholipase D-like domain-containing protein n=1 Tax=Nostoc sp. UIC 10607 TaxID=3045935 RepID=UPI0039A2ACB0